MTMLSAMEIIPICCYCKRTKNGNNEWLPLECYADPTARIRLSLTVCPDCEEKYYDKTH